MDLKPIIETQIKNQLSLRLVSMIGLTIGGPLAKVITWALSKYIIGPALVEINEAIKYEIDKIKSRRRVNELNEADNHADFDTAFNKL